MSIRVTWVLAVCLIAVLAVDAVRMDAMRGKQQKKGLGGMLSGMFGGGGSGQPAPAPPTDAQGQPAAPAAPAAGGNGLDALCDKVPFGGAGMCKQYLQAAVAGAASAPDNVCNEALGKPNEPVCALAEGTPPGNGGNDPTTGNQLKTVFGYLPMVNEQQKCQGCQQLIKAGRGQAAQQQQGQPGQTPPAPATPAAPEHTGHKKKLKADKKDKKDKKNKNKKSSSSSSSSDSDAKRKKHWVGERKGDKAYKDTVQYDENGIPLPKVADGEYIYDPKSYGYDRSPYYRGAPERDMVDGTTVLPPVMLGGKMLEEDIHRRYYYRQGTYRIHHMSKDPQCNIFALRSELAYRSFEMLDEYGYSPLHFAAQRHQLDGLTLDIVEVLLKYKCSPTEPNPRTLETPLHVAAAQGNHLVLEMMLEVMFKEWDQPYLKTQLLKERGSVLTDRKGQTPLYYAVKAGNLECIQVLLQYGSYPLETDNSRQSVYQKALKKHFKARENVDVTHKYDLKFPRYKAEMEIAESAVNLLNDSPAVREYRSWASVFPLSLPTIWTVLLAILVIICINSIAISRTTGYTSGYMVNQNHALSENYGLKELVMSRLVNAGSVPFTSIDTVDDFWTYMTDTFAPVIAANEFGLQNTFVGAIRMSQKRINGVDCPNTGIFSASGTGTCVERDWDDASVQTANFGSTNQFAFTDARAEGEYSPKSSNLGLLGKQWDDYGGFDASYQQVLKVADAATFATTFATLNSNGWIDRTSRIVVVDFSTYNQNVQLLAVVRLLVEFQASGGVIPTADVVIVPAADLSDDVLLYLAEFYVWFYIVVMIVSEVLYIRESFSRNGFGLGVGKVFFNLWHIIDITNIVLYFTAFSYMALFQEERTHFVDFMGSGTPDASLYYDFTALASYAGSQSGFYAICVVLFALKLPRVVAEFPPFRVFTRSVVDTISDNRVIGMICLVGCFVFAFALAFQILVGGLFSGYVNFLGGMLGVTAMIYGADENISDMSTSGNRNFGFVLVFLMFTVVAVIGLQLFIGLLTAIYQEKIKKNTVMHELELNKGMEDWMYLKEEGPTFFQRRVKVWYRKQVNRLVKVKPNRHAEQLFQYSDEAVKRFLQQKHMSPVYNQPAWKFYRELYFRHDSTLMSLKYQDTIARMDVVLDSFSSTYLKLEKNMNDYYGRMGNVERRVHVLESLGDQTVAMLHRVLERINYYNTHSSSHSHTTHVYHHDQPPQTPAPAPPKTPPAKKPKEEVVTKDPPVKIQKPEPKREHDDSHLPEAFKKGWWQGFNTSKTGTQGGPPAGLTGPTVGPGTGGLPPVTHPLYTRSQQSYPHQPGHLSGHQYDGYLPRPVLSPETAASPPPVMVHPGYIVSPVHSPQTPHRDIRSDAHLPTS
eukprot:GFYU01002512.1.p1 GENE.GFYU01002512.1~~GFYU01002512.1.p1  ORF type:complete len:1378 (+),score=492.90 GFYU01002512.1:38-4171(+)